MIRKTMFAVATAFSFYLAGFVSAQAQNTVPGFSYGPTASAFSIRFENTNGNLDSKFGMLSEGLGWSFNVNNIVHSADGGMSWLGVKFPLYPRIEESEFALAMGGELSFFNNLLGFGAAVDAINTSTDRGFFIGKVEAPDVMVTVSFGFNLGGGTTPAAVAEKGAIAAYNSKAPFNFVSFRR